MTLRIVTDGIDDSLAANPEPPRADLGYEATNSPRGRAAPARLRYWAIVERDGVAPSDAAGSVGGEAKHCRTCGEVAAILHAIGSDPRRLYCGRCQGDANRKIVGYAQAAEPEQKGPRR